MKKVKDLLKQSAPGIAASSKTLPTEAGRTENTRDDESLIDTINQVFSLFRINYHNQYHAAFGDTVTVNQAKRLWKEGLQYFGNELILRAARRVIEESEYLPTLQRMLSACEASLADYGLPDPRKAYLEAANAPSPKNAQHWSHPIVYLAGKTVGWYAMSHVAENITYPAYRDAYRELLKEALGGKEFVIDAPERIDHQPGKKADVDSIRKELKELRDLLAD